MKGKIILSKDEWSVYNYDIEYDDEYEYIIRINTDLTENFLDLISDYHDMDEAIDFSIYFSETDDSEYAEDNIAFLKECKSKKLELLQNAKYVEFDFTIEEIAKYVKINPILKTKKIIINDSYDLNIEKLQILKDAFSDYRDNLYFNLSNNSKLISFNECNETYNAIEKITKEVESLNLSPLEKIMYVYDIVRNKVYKEVAENEDKLISRDLTSSLLGEERVCLGYARIFETILNKLGIEARQCILYGNVKGHARNEIYVKDEKYNVDGVYYFDTTWDSKKSENNNEYLSTYRFFAKTKSEMDELDKDKYTDQSFPYYSPEIAWKFEEILENEGFENLSQDMIKSINHMSSLIKEQRLLGAMYTAPISPLYGKIDKDKTITELIDIAEYFDKPLSADTLLKVLYNVRKKQYYLEPDKYPFSLSDFYKIVLLSDWRFEDAKTKEQKLLIAIFGNKARTKDKSQMLDYDQKAELSKNIERVKLTRTLRKIYDKKK